MKTIFASICLFIFSFQLRSQTLPEQFSLVEYAPTITAQSGTNSSAYAAAYVNMSTQLAFKKSVRNPSPDDALSFGFVDGTIQYFQKQLGKKKFIKIVADTLYEGGTDVVNDLDYVFYALHQYGTIPYVKFPYQDAKEVKAYFDPTLLSDKSIYKINIPTEVFNPDDSFSQEKLNSFKKYISSGVPVMIAIDQPVADCDWNNLATYDTDKNNEDGNHIANIVGYNDMTGQFIIKNNYEKDCLIIHNYADVFKILRWAYVLDFKN